MRYIRRNDMKYVGMDIHKKFCVATEMDKEGNIARKNVKIKTNEKDIDKGKASS